MGIKVHRSCEQNFILSEQSHLKDEELNFCRCFVSYWRFHARYENYHCFANCGEFIKFISVLNVNQCMLLSKYKQTLEESVWKTGIKNRYIKNWSDLFISSILCCMRFIFKKRRKNTMSPNIHTFIILSW